MDEHRKAIIHGSGQSGYRTPPELVSKVFPIFDLQFDLAANTESRVCPIFLGPGSVYAEDSMQADWMQVAKALRLPPRGFLNPPYSLDEIRELREMAEHRTIDNLQERIDALKIEKWAEKACNESLRGFTTIGVFPYAPQTEWFRTYVMGHDDKGGWWGHAALDYWRIPHRVSFLLPDGAPTNNAGVNTCVIQWGPNPGFRGPWVPSGRYWSYR